MAWVLQERGELVACTIRAAATHPEHALRLAADLVPFLRRARLLDDGVTVASTAVQAADALDHRSAAGAWNNLGSALAEVWRFDEAITAHQQAVDIFSEFGDHYRHAQTLNNLGAVHAELSRPEPARRAWAEAVERYATAGAGDEAEELQRWVAERDP